MSWQLLLPPALIVIGIVILIFIFVPKIRRIRSSKKNGRHGSGDGMEPGGPWHHGGGVRMQSTQQESRSSHALGRDTYEPQQPYPQNLQYDNRRPAGMPPQVPGHGQGGYPQAGGAPSQMPQRGASQPALYQSSPQQQFPPQQQSYGQPGAPQYQNTAGEQHTAVPPGQDMSRYEEDLIERIASNPRDIEAYERLGDYYFGRHGYEDAKECYKQVIRLAPKNVPVKQKMKQLERFLGKKQGNLFR